MRSVIFLLVLVHLIFSFAFSAQYNREHSQNDEMGKTDQNKTGHTKINITDKLIGIYQSRIKRNPNSYLNYTKLGETFIQKARETGDISYYHKAEGVFQEALRLNPQDYATVAYLGKVSFAKHNFASAAEYAKKAVEIRPMHSLAYGILGDAYAELGKYDQAEEAYTKMVNIQPGLDSYSRIASIKKLKGEVEGAIQVMRRAVEEGINEARSDENIAWAQFILGEMYFDKGNLEDAEEQYKISIKTFSNYHYALAGLAKVKASQKHYEESIKLGSSPSLRPELSLSTIS